MKRIVLNLLGTLAVCSALNLQFSTALAQGTGLTMLTITNPTPAAYDSFGASVAAAETGHVLIGAWSDDLGATDAGAAHLFSASGAWLTTFTNPTPAASDYFGFSVAVVGADQVLIGAYGDDTGATDAGAAYLFNTNGALITTFINPKPSTGASFGYSVAVKDAARVLIGAPYDNTGASNSGAAYLFSTNGTLLATFNNPTPAASDWFGISMAEVGTGTALYTAGVLIGAPGDDTVNPNAGAVYLFRTNGTLLTTFTKPDAAMGDAFGVSVAALGDYQLLIGADEDNSGARDSGAAYLFGMGRNLVSSFVNPTPVSLERFGRSVAAVGTDRVLIGAYRDGTGAGAAGAAYLFNTSGALLTTFTNPTPAESDWFGISVAAMGNDQVVIGAPGDDTGGTDVGVAYLFTTRVQTPAGFTWQTITNPTSAALYYHGSFSVAALGADRVLVGASGDCTGEVGAGAAYLFSTNGALLTTFTNPTPAFDARFGSSVTVVGTDRVLVGAYLDDTGADAAGAAYLFSTNGALLTTFTNPTPALDDWFGYSVAAVGSDTVVVGAFFDNTRATDAGAAYLFSTNGALLTTFTNPTPALGDWFGWSVAAVGSDRVVIGAIHDDTVASQAGAAYLFSTNGALLTTFTNPPPNPLEFGSSVAGVGTDRVLIGAKGTYPTPSIGATGAAYLFSTNGALLMTFTNPTSQLSSYFGSSVAAVGTDRVLIGASSGVSARPRIGAAYLFNTNGALLARLTNPTRANDYDFSSAMTVVGSDRVLIWSDSDNAVYLFSPIAQLFGNPGLAVCLTITNAVAVSWPSLSTGWTLQQNTSGVASVNWSNASGMIQDDGTTKTLIVPPSAENRFYRLFKP